MIGFIIDLVLIVSGLVGIAQFILVFGVCAGVWLYEKGKQND